MLKFSNGFHSFWTKSSLWMASKTLMTWPLPTFTVLSPNTPYPLFYTNCLRIFVYLILQTVFASWPLSILFHLSRMFSIQLIHLDVSSKRRSLMFSSLASHFLVLLSSIALLYLFVICFLSPAFKYGRHEAGGFVCSSRQVNIITHSRHLITMFGRTSAFIFNVQIFFLFFIIHVSTPT